MLRIRRFIRLGSAGVLLGGLAVGVAALNPLSGEAEGAPTTANPNQPITESLNSVSCTSTTNCIAVGFQSNTIGPGPQTTLTEIWNGASWSVAPSPNPGNNVNDLSGVSCTSSTDCVAVGYYFNTSASQTISQTLIEKWNGASWSVTPSPDQGNGGSVLYGVFCTSSTNCVAVGDYINGSGDFQTLIETWNGTGWSIIPSPDPGTPSSGLDGVHCASSTNCVAVGYYFNGPSTQGLVEAWNGTIWSVSPSPNPADAGAANLASVSCTSATDCVAVGDYINGSGSQVLTESWNGTIWSVTTSPNQGTDTLSSVSCISSTNCVGVGNFSTGSGDPTLIESWNGISWFVTPSPSPGANAYLNGVSCISSTGCFAVGQTFDKSNASQVLVESWNGTSWSVVLPPPPTTSVLVPSNGSTVNGAIWLDAGASSPVGIASVSYEVSGGSISDQVVSSSVGTIFGWLGAWDTSDVPNGTYTLQSVATDNLGNSATGAGISVTVDNLPLQTAVLVPSNGATLSGSSAVLDASASGTSDVTGVQFVVSGGSISDQVVGTASPTIYGWIAEWNTTGVPNGSYTLQSVATEMGGTTAMSTGVTIMVNNAP
jgi:hypothetical protein